MRNALTRFGQVKGASDRDRDLGWANILAAAEYYGGVTIGETDWRELGKRT